MSKALEKHNLWITTTPCPQALLWSLPPTRSSSYSSIDSSIGTLMTPNFLLKKIKKFQIKCFKWIHLITSIAVHLTFWDRQKGIKFGKQFYPLFSRNVFNWLVFKNYCWKFFFFFFPYLLLIIIFYIVFLIIFHCPVFSCIF